MIVQLEATHDIKVDEINVEDYAPKSSVKKALLLHDTYDRVLPVEKSREVAHRQRDHFFNQLICHWEIIL